jgi:hypothetical protein
MDKLIILAVMTFSTLLIFSSQQVISFAGDLNNDNVVDILDLVIVS